MRVIAHILSAFFLVAFLGAAWRVTPFEVAAPDAALLVALYLGASVRGQAWEVTVAALVIGYLGDVVGGAPRGLGAFVVGATCLLARLATARLLVRGAIFTTVFCFVGALFAAALGYGLRAVFGGGGELGRASVELPAAAVAALLTALFAPVVFRICRWVDARFARTAREREALREGISG
jgi:rod shape-determining protein MreD